MKGATVGEAAGEIKKKKRKKKKSSVEDFWFRSRRLRVDGALWGNVAVSQLWSDRRTEGRTAGSMDGRLDGRADGLTDGRTDGRKESCNMSFFYPHQNLNSHHTDWLTGWRRDGRMERKKDRAAYGTLFVFLWDWSEYFVKVMKITMNSGAKSELIQKRTMKWIVHPGNEIDT